MRFNRALEQTKDRERAEQARIQAEREEEKRQAQIAAEHAARLSAARVELDRAIAEVKRARQTGQGRDEADAHYRSAKAVVVELESGTRPDWAPDEPSD